jgi:hypothetical protein
MVHLPASHSGLKGEDSFYTRFDAPAHCLDRSKRRDLELLIRCSRLIRTVVT